LQEALTALEEAIHGIVARYQGRLKALNAELQAELEPFRQPIKTLRHAIEELRDTFNPMLPERPEPAPPEVDEEHWLFDTQRDYLTQLAMYKARKTAAMKAPTDHAAD
jgi:hypothetical protein